MVRNSKLKTDIEDGESRERATHNCGDVIQISPCFVIGSCLHMHFGDRTTGQEINSRAAGEGGRDGWEITSSVASFSAKLELFVGGVDPIIDLHRAYDSGEGPE